MNTGGSDASFPGRLMRAEKTSGEGEFPLPSLPDLPEDLLSWEESIVSEGTSRPRVSIIIPNWNGSPFLFECLASMASMGARRREVEILLVDNGSKDGSGLAARESFPGIRLLAQETNLGFAAAVNRGIWAARGDYIALVNNDTAWGEDWILPAADYLEAHPEYGFAAPVVHYYRDRTRVDSAGDGWNLRLMPLKRESMGDARIGRDEVDLNAASGSAVVFRRSFFDRVGGLDERFFMYYEDAELFLRAWLRGEKGRLLPWLNLCHHEGASIRRLGGGLPSRKAFYLARNRTLLLAKALPSMYGIVLAPLLAVEWLRSLFWFMRKGRGREFMGGIWAALKMARSSRIRRRILANTSVRRAGEMMMEGWRGGRRISGPGAGTISP